MLLGLLLHAPLLAPLAADSPAREKREGRPPAGDLMISAPLGIKWHFRTPQTLYLSPAVTRQFVFLPLSGGLLVALRSTDGELLWRAEVGGEVSSSPVADDRSVYVASSVGQTGPGLPPPSGTIRALSRESGVTLWSRSLGRPLQGSLAQTADFLFAGAADGKVYAIRKTDGEIVWSRTASAREFASQPTIEGSSLFIGNDDGTLFAIDQKSGGTLWRYRTRGPIRGPVVFNGETVYVGSGDGKVYALDRNRGKLLWSKRTGAGVQSLVGGQLGILAASLDNFVYFLSLRRGDLLWKRQLAGRILSQPLVYGESVVLTPLVGDMAVILSLADGKQLNVISLLQDDATGAPPVLAANLLLITTRSGLVAFGNQPATVRRVTAKPTSESTP